MPKLATRDDTIDVLHEILKRRLRETFDRFCAEIPQLLEEMQRAPGPVAASPEGREFVRALVAWVGSASRRSEQASRYFLMWYAKTLAGKCAHETLDCRAVAELLRKHLRQDELAAVDQALADGWKALAKSRSLTELAFRRRKQFLASLTQEQRKRFEPYLAAFLPAIPWPISPPADLRPGVGARSAPAGSWMARQVVSAAIVVGLPLLAALGWYAVHGHTAKDQEASAGSALPGALRPTGEVRQVAPVADTTPSTLTAGVPHTAAPAGRVLPTGSPSYSWTRRTSGTTSHLNGIAWSGRLAVAVGFDGTIVASEDGVAWTAAPQVAAYSYMAVVYAKSMFIAVGTSRRGTHYGRIVSASADGMVWTTQRWEERTGLNSIAHGKGVLVAIGNSGAIVRSTDGESWHTVTSKTSEHLDGVSYLEDRFVVIGHNGTTMFSPDGQTWSLKQHPVSTLYFGAELGNRTYLAVGQRRSVQGAGQAMVWLSPDLKAWTEQEVSGSTGFRNVIFANGRFVANGTAGGILSSSDGLEWTMEVPLSSFPGGGDLVWTGSMLIAVGQSGAIYTGVSASSSPSSP